MKHWFLPENPDLLRMLRDQVAVTVDGLDAFARWSAGDAGAVRELRDAEHTADDKRRALQTGLRAAFSTPIDGEDLYELSERIDLVLNEAKNAAREAEVMELAPNQHLAAMANAIVDGSRHLQRALAALGIANDDATAAADAAVKSEREIERVYRRAMTDVLALAEIREVIAWREMYRRYARIGDALVHAAHRIWYAVVKES